MCSTNLGFSVENTNLGFSVGYVLCASYVCTWYQPADHTHTHSNVRLTTAASETEGVAAVSWIESPMIRRPLGSIDPNSIRETELHTESRRRHSRGERETVV